MNVLGDEKKQQVIALGRLGWSLRRIQSTVGVRRETASAYLRAAGIAVRAPGGSPSEWTPKPATAEGVSTDPDGAKPATAEGVISPNLTTEVVFDNIFPIDSRRVTAFSTPFQPSSWYHPPSFDPGTVALFATADRSLSDLVEPTRSKTRLSLRWAQNARRDLSVVDAFLKLWIALETLTMIDSNIAPLVAVLKDAYRMSQDEIHNVLGVGPICSLRGKIVHEGRLDSLDTRLVKFAFALYEDALIQTLGLPCERRAEKLTTQPPLQEGAPAFEVIRYLQGVLR